MNALVFKSQEDGLKFITDFPKPIAKDGEVIVKLSAGALNHRDVWITKGLYPGIEPNIVLGSDGVGEYEGAAVLINPNLNWEIKKPILLHNTVF